MPPDSALDSWGALDIGWQDRIEENLASKEVAACKAKPANKKQVEHTQDETQKHGPDSTQK